MKKCGNCIYRFDKDREWYCGYNGFEPDIPIDLKLTGCVHWKGDFDGMVH